MKEPKIMRMDWKSLGYEKVFRDGKLKWIPIKNYNAIDIKDNTDS